MTTKTVTLTFKTPTAKLTFFKALESRLVACGYGEDCIRDLWTLDVCGALTVTISGTADAERAADVANECAGVSFTFDA